MSLTKGKNAFVVCTHIDRHHVHNHIIINSTSLDCTCKFRNFWGSTWAIRRLNDKLCLEHGLSIVENPKPSRSHYGTWLGDDQRLSQQERLRRIIDEVLADSPQDFPDFLKKLEAAGVEVNQERKNLRLRLSPQDRFTRCNTLKGDYTEMAIRERIAGQRTVQLRHIPKTAPPKVGLLVDIEAAMLFNAIKISVSLSTQTVIQALSDWHLFDLDSIEYRPGSGEEPPHIVILDSHRHDE